MCWKYILAEFTTREMAYAMVQRIGLATGKLRDQRDELNRLYDVRLRRNRIQPPGGGWLDLHKGRVRGVDGNGYAYDSINARRHDDYVPVGRDVNIIS